MQTRYFRDRAELGKTLTSLHNNSGLSVRHVAAKTGLSSGSILSWQKGRSWPSTGSLITLLAFYGAGLAVGNEVQQ